MKVHRISVKDENGNHRGYHWFTSLRKARAAHKKMLKVFPKTENIEPFNIPTNDKADLVAWLNMWVSYPDND